MTAPPSRSAPRATLDSGEEPDVIVVGSGFGGAVAAMRLAQAGKKVLVLERGRRWEREDYPRRLRDPWLYSPTSPHRRNGWLDVRVLDQMVVITGAGVGGGSLVYANVCIDAPDEVFATGWPAQIDADELAPHYRAVADMLDPQPVPPEQEPARTQLMRDAARSLDARSRFRTVDLAITFDPSWRPGDTRDPARSPTSINRHGARQGTCVHCGECDIGCRAWAKNTLDRNYLAVAETAGATVRPLSPVGHVARDGDRWAVHFCDVAAGARRRHVARAPRVILAAGSIGSTEILLRSRDQWGTLPDLPRSLGRGWSSNGDFLTPSLHPFRRIDADHGPTITAAIDYLDGKPGARVFLEDGGFPPLPFPGAGHVMPWFGQAVDASDGTFTLRRSRLRPWRHRLTLDWNPHRSATAIDTMAHVHRRAAHATDGVPLPLLSWKWLRALITPHPLGGAAMAASRAAGVVDHRCEVFDHPGLFVMDGAVIPRAIGRNPSKTIAAVAERAIDLLLDADRTAGRVVIA